MLRFTPHFRRQWILWAPKRTINYIQSAGLVLDFAASEYDAWLYWGELTMLCYLLFIQASIRTIRQPLQPQTLSWSNYLCGRLNAHNCVNDDWIVHLATLASQSAEKPFEHLTSQGTFRSYLRIAMVMRRFAIRPRKSYGRSDRLWDWYCPWSFAWYTLSDDIWIWGQLARKVSTGNCGKSV